MSAGLSPLLPRRPSPLSLRFFLFFSPSVPQWESLLVLESRCCSAGDSADALAHVENMERNQVALWETLSAEARCRAAFFFFAFRPRRIQQWGLGASAFIIG